MQRGRSVKATTQEMQAQRVKPISPDRPHLETEERREASTGEGGRRHRQELAAKALELVLAHRRMEAIDEARVQVPPGSRRGDQDLRGTSAI